MNNIPSKKHLLVLLFSFLLWECNENADTIQDYFEWTPDRKPLISAHRGGPYPGYPENCIETFEQVLKYTDAIIECDIAMTKDSVLIMMHDYSLDRTTTGTGKVANFTYNEIKRLHLRDNEGIATEFKIPTLDKVLEWSKNKCILTLDVKRGVPFERVILAVEKAETKDNSVIITYNVEDAHRVYQLDPDLMISVGIYTTDDLKRYDSTGIPFENLIAFTGTAEKDPFLYDLLHKKGIYCILGTLGNLDKRAEARGDHIYLEFIRNGVDILATDRPIEAAEAIRPYEDQ